MKMLQHSLVFVSFLAVQANATIRYVSPSGGGSGDGLSWINAFPGASLQAAINSSVPGDEVWVMAGTYRPTITNNRNIYFSMRNGVAIYGSFSGTETSISQRSFSCGFSSILSGEIGLAGNADNSYHVISNSSVSNTAILDGFTISDGHANFDLLGNDDRSLGGGMLNTGSNGGLSSPVVRNCLFTNNTALFGGGIFNHGQNSGNANPIVTNCIFAFNTATGGGGGIDNFGYNGNASPIITNCVFYNNTAAERAGAMYCWGGGNGNASPVILNSVFVNNSSIDGGGIVSDRTNFASGSSGTANPTIRNSIFWGNTASGAGPQFYILGGAGFAATYSAIDITGQSSPHAITGPGTGNILTAPSFINIADADGIDNCWLSSDDGLQLQTNSSGIDAGDNTGVPAADIRNYNRIANGVVDLGPYESNSNILPVHLISFSGRVDGNTNILSWITASENNNRSFEIQRSVDAIQFEKIGDLPGSGNSGVMRQYQFTDNRLFHDQYYYRLKQTDIDGRYTYSTTILVINKMDKKDILVFPNPVVSTATILFRKQILKNEEFLLINSHGQTVDKLMVNGNTATINLEGKPAGIYRLVNRKAGTSLIVCKVTE
jgi:hypothetical protein